MSDKFEIFSKFYQYFFLQKVNNSKKSDLPTVTNHAVAAEPQLFRFLVFDFHLPQSRGQLSPISGWKPNFTLKRNFATRMWQKFVNFGGSRFDSNGEKLISYLIDRKSKIMESQHRSKCTNFIDHPIISLSAFGAVCEKL